MAAPRLVRPRRCRRPRPAGRQPARCRPCLAVGCVSPRYGRPCACPACPLVRLSHPRRWAFGSGRRGHSPLDSPTALRWRSSPEACWLLPGGWQPGLAGHGVDVDGVRRLVGPHFSPNHTALYLLRTFFLGVGLAAACYADRTAAAQKWYSAGGILLWAATALVLLALVLTGSRGALLLGLPAGLLVLAWAAAARASRAAAWAGDPSGHAVAVGRGAAGRRGCRRAAVGSPAQSADAQPAHRSLGGITAPVARSFAAGRRPGRLLLDLSGLSAAGRQRRAKPTPPAQCLAGDCHHLGPARLCLARISACGS